MDNETTSQGALRDHTGKVIGACDSMPLNLPMRHGARSPRALQPTVRRLTPQEAEELRAAFIAPVDMSKLIPGYRRLP